MDKVQKILNEITTRKLCTMDEHMAFYNDKAKEDYRFLSEIEEVIKALQGKPVSDELEKVVEEIVDTTVLNAYGVKDIANRLRRTMIEPVSEDLEEAANDAVISLVPSFGQKYSDGSYVSCIRDSFKREELIKLYKAGAEWQKQKDESYTKSMYKVGINTGKELMKQQLMAKAVDAVVKVEAGNYPYIPQMELYDYDKDIPLAKEGDRYKVVLIKEAEL